MVGHSWTWLWPRDSGQNKLKCIWKVAEIITQRTEESKCWKSKDRYRRKRIRRRRWWSNRHNQPHNTGKNNALPEFTGCPRRKKICKAPPINNTSNPVIVFVFFYYQIAVCGGKPIILLVLTLSNGLSPLPDVNESEMFLFLTTQTWHFMQDRLTDSSSHSRTLHFSL